MALLWVYQEGSHFISCLQLADQNLRQKHKDETNLRWIVVALHDALYAILIEKLTRTDGFGIFNDSFEEKINNFYETGLCSNSPEFLSLCEESSKQNLAGIGKLLSRANLPSGAKIKYSNRETLKSPSRGLSQLKAMRDFFSHPKPMLSGYDVDHINESVSDTIKVINEVRMIPSATTARHDEIEATILIASIEHYSAKWFANINKDQG